jgi:hypothetical protein
MHKPQSGVMNVIYAGAVANQIPRNILPKFLPIKVIYRSIYIDSALGWET